MNKVISKIFNSVVLIQLIFLIIFLLENYSNLSNVPFSYDFDLSYVHISGTVPLNFYLLLTGVALFYILGAIIGVQAAASGLNEASTKIIQSIIGQSVMFAILNSGILVILNALGTIPNLIINLFIAVIYGLSAIDKLRGENE